MTTPAEQPSIIDVFAFICELAMLALLVVAGHWLVDGWSGWLLGALFAAVAIAIWSCTRRAICCIQWSHE